MSPRADEPRSFDHSAFAALPEYHDARIAIAVLADALDRMAGPRQLSDAQLVEALADMARTRYADDACPHCDEHTGYVYAWPHAVTVRDGWMLGTYRCPITGRTWTCGFATPHAYDTA